ncbi:tetratricopeptide repeat protein [Streptomyces sp. NPDC017964]|uniref:tetratricopeptide repeat protein n=1 Tax=Streptomyces sp. NPDC017964 TaxID=3365022 RepID=UPI0037AF9F65
MANQRASRRALVIGSQCAALGRLSFLPQVAEDLAALLTDPRLGDCESALEPGPLLVDPSWTTMITAVQKAFRTANDSESTLVLALLGHGIANDEDFYFLPRNGTGSGSSYKDVFLSQLLKEELRNAAYLDGLLVLLDTCHAGVGAAQAAKWQEVGLGRHLRRYEMVTASADRPAYGGKVTKALIDVLRCGIPAAGTTIDARYLGDPLWQAAPDQRPQRITRDGGGWRQPGDEGLWWAHNAAHDVTANGAGALGAVRDRIVELTGHLQPTAILGDLVTAAETSPRVALVGPRGSGKSTLAAALARPETTRGRVPARFVQAIAFATRASTLADLAGTLAAQLEEAVPGFTDASHRYLRRLSSGEKQSLDALHQHVTGPLTLVAPPPAVRLVIDALDELPAATRSSLVHALTAADAELRLVVTARPDSPRPPGSHILSTAQASDDTITAYLHARGVAEGHRPTLVRHASGNWLHAHLLADRALRPGFDVATLPDDMRLTLTALYDDELLAAGAHDTSFWQSTLRPIIGVLAVAGAGPVLPLPLLVTASGHLHGPATTTQVRDALVSISGLVVRTQPGQPAEHVGLFHSSLAEDYLVRPDNGQFTVEPSEYHAALAEAIKELAPLDRQTLTDPLHQYALGAEAHHRWNAYRDSGAVIESLKGRSAGSAVNERELWHHWPAIFEATLGPEHAHTLTARANLAAATGMAGDWAAARDEFAELVPLYEQVLGREHPDTLRNRAIFAKVTGKAGDWAAARDQFAELLPIVENELGPKDPETLTVRSDLATWTGEAGNWAAARDQFAELLPLRTSVSGAKDPETLSVRSNLASSTGSAGNWAAARDQFAELLPVFENVLGPKDPATLNHRANLGNATGEADDPVTARAKFSELLPVYEEVLGPEHPDTLTARSNLAGWTGEAGDWPAARDQFAELLPVRQQVLGPEHPHTLYTRASLARANRHAGNPGAARDELARLVPVYEKVLGLDHPDTIIVRKNLDSLESAGLAN